MINHGDSSNNLGILKHSKKNTIWQVNVADSKVLRIARREPRLTNDWEKSWRSLDWKPFLDLFLSLDHFLGFFISQVDWPHNSCFWWTSRNLRLQKPWWFIPFLDGQLCQLQFFMMIFRSKIHPTLTSVSIYVKYSSNPHSKNGTWLSLTTFRHPGALSLDTDLGMQHTVTPGRFSFQIIGSLSCSESKWGFPKILYPRYSRMIHDIIL